MSITRWNPRQEVITMREAMNRLFDDAFGFGMDEGGVRMARLPIDAWATDDEIIVTASLPGVRPEDVEITVEGDTLTIRGEMSTTRESENTRMLIAERFVGSFSRSLKLVTPVEVDKIDAQFENGLLTITLPKAEEIKPKVIKVLAK